MYFDIHRLYDVLEVDACPSRRNDYVPRRRKTRACKNIRIDTVAAEPRRVRFFSFVLLVCFSTKIFGFSATIDLHSVRSRRLPSRLEKHRVRESGIFNVDDQPAYVSYV